MALPNAKFEVYEGKDGEWRWRFIARNGKIMADSAEGYESATGADGALARFLCIAPNADVYFSDGEEITEWLA